MRYWQRAIELLCCTVAFSCAEHAKPQEESLPDPADEPTGPNLSPEVQRDVSAFAARYGAIENWAPTERELPSPVYTVYAQRVLHVFTRRPILFYGYPEDVIQKGDAWEVVFSANFLSKGYGWSGRLRFILSANSSQAEGVVRAPRPMAVVAVVDSVKRASMLEYDEEDRYLMVEREDRFIVRGRCLGILPLPEEDL